MKIVADQSNAFTRTLLQPGIYKIGSVWPYGYVEKKRTVVEYKLRDEAEPGNINVKYYRNANLVGTEWQEEPEVLAVCVIWGKMNQTIYTEKLTQMNPLYNKIKESVPKSRDCLIAMGYLAYDLSRFIALQRGSAAAASIIIRGIGLAKGFPGIGNMRIRGLPFDIYAHMQQNRDQYAIEFCDAFGSRFQLTCR